MVPVYIASLTGAEVFRTGVSGRRLTVFLHSLSFVLGFSIIFILLGSSAGMIGFIINSHLVLIRQIAGGLMVLFGLFMLAATKIPWLNYEKRLNPAAGDTGGYLRSLVIGLLFALAWTPCVGPVLGGILSLALNSGSSWQGGYLLAFYSLGVALPFLAIGLAFDSVLPLLKRLSRYSVYVYIFSGLLLITIGILIILNKMSWFSV
jgi:cytochrome c biogenesis protein CcdA